MSRELLAMEMTPQDREALRTAVRLLENPSFAARLANVVGMPVEKVLAALPQEINESVQTTARNALRKALEVAVYKLDSRASLQPPDTALKSLTALTGGIGGFFGLPALAVELPVTTVVMLRSIAHIARSEGEELGSPESRLECLKVLALGGRRAGDDSAESGYFAVRAALAKAVSDAAKYIAQRGLAEETAPALVRLIGAIASRFGIVVSEKAAAGAVPVIGAIGAATINVLFMDHFQSMAHGHFTVRRLEREYGADAVREEYERLRRLPFAAGVNS